MGAGDRRLMPDRLALPDWPRLMPEPMAAAYLQIGTTTLRERGPAPKRIGRAVRYHRADLDRWADTLDGEPLNGAEEEAEALEVERRFLARRHG